MTKPRFTAAIAVLVLVTGACGGDRGAADSPESFRDWIVANRDHVGLVALRLGDQPETIALDADERFPLASTRKVLILGTYAQQVAAGTLDPRTRVPVAEIERWYWPGTDGGAHENATEEWSTRRLVRNATVALDDVARAMIRWSDNAASDEMLQRVGGPAPVAAFARRMGMRHQDELMPVLGEFVAWAKHRPDAWAKLGPRKRALAGAALARATTRDAVVGLTEPTISDQRAFARSSPAGSPADWAALMEKLHAPGTLPATASALVRKHLGWPLGAFPSNRDRFERFAAKGGSLAGLITEAMYVQPKGRPAIAVALFLRDLPPDADAELGESFVHQSFLVKLAEDEAFWRDVREALG